jgi:hypothetical protein
VRDCAQWQDYRVSILGQDPQEMGRGLGHMPGDAVGLQPCSLGVQVCARSSDSRMARLIHLVSILGADPQRYGTWPRARARRRWKATVTRSRCAGHCAQWRDYHVSIRPPVWVAHSASLRCVSLKFFRFGLSSSSSSCSESLLGTIFHSWGGRYSISGGQGRRKTCSRHGGGNCMPVARA